MSDKHNECLHTFRRPPLHRLLSMGHDLFLVPLQITNVDVVYVDVIRSLSTMGHTSTMKNNLMRVLSWLSARLLCCEIEKILNIFSDAITWNSEM